MNRVRTTQEGNGSRQVQSQLDKFFMDQPKWQHEMESRIHWQLDEIRESNRTTTRSEPVTYPVEEAVSAPRNRVICFNCGGTGHIARQCRQRQQLNPNYTLDPPATEPDAPPATNNTTRIRPVSDSQNAIYVRGTINGHPRTYLIDTGSEVSLVPLSMVEGLSLQPSNRTLLAANGTDIRVVGALAVLLKISRRFAIESSFLVSDQIGEIMLGMDWLRQHRCRISFGTGAIFVGRRRISLVKGSGTQWCRRIRVAEKVTIPPRTQCDVTCKVQFPTRHSSTGAWMTEAREVRPGVHLARVVIGDCKNPINIRMLNLGEQPATLIPDQIIGDLHSVEVGALAPSIKASTPLRDVQLMDELMADLAEDVPHETKVRLRELLLEYRSIFSTADDDLGSTPISEHRIDTGDARPVRQPLRRQPLPYQLAIDEQLKQMLSSGVEELERQFRTAYTTVRAHLGKAAERRKRDYDLKVRPAKFLPDDQVYYFTPRRFVGRSPKWQLNFTGSYRIVRSCGPIHFLIQRTAKAKPFIVHVDKLRPCYEAVSASADPQRASAAGDEARDATRNSNSGSASTPTGWGTAEASARQAETRDQERPRRTVQRPARYRSIRCRSLVRGPNLMFLREYPRF